MCLCSIQKSINLSKFWTSKAINAINSGVKCNKELRDEISSFANKGYCLKPSDGGVMMFAAWIRTDYFTGKKKRIVELVPIRRLGKGFLD
jgi:hypothetical protein